MARPAIWDALLFNDEIDLLALRARWLAGTVDHVLLVEGNTTFTGTPKPSHFAESGLDLGGFDFQLHTVVADLSGIEGTPWLREEAQRRAMRSHLLEHAGPDDLLLLGDVDEFPRPAVLTRLAGARRPPTRLFLADCLYHANWQRERPWGNGPIATRLDGFDEPAVRGMLGDPVHLTATYDEEFLPDAGWHLSFVGDTTAIRRKLSAYSHQELNQGGVHEDDFLEGCLRYGTHFAGWAPVWRTPLEDLDPELAALADLAPSLFDFGAPPAKVATLSWCLWARMHDRVPSAVARRLDRHPWLVTGALAPVLAPLQLARRRGQRTAPHGPPGQRLVRSPLAAQDRKPAK